MRARLLGRICGALAIVLAGCGDEASPIVDAAPDAIANDGAVDAADAPVIDAPAIDAPSIDALDVDAPVIDAPAIDAPAIDAPEIDASAIDASAIDAPAIDAPAIDASPIDSSPIDASPIDAAVAQFLTPQPYLGSADSPFSGLPVFHLEDFEDGLLNTPGATASSTTRSSSFGIALIDSVDNDDGMLDGTCQVGCDALFGFGSITFTFDAVALGGLPTHVGVVWTDGGVGATITLAAYDAGGASLGSTTVAGIPDGNHNGGTAEDRLFGVIAFGGVSRIEISNSSGGIEVDHLQYGR